jgi:hypothetical protein
MSSRVRAVFETEHGLRSRIIEHRIRDNKTEHEQNNEPETSDAHEQLTIQ